MSISSSTNTVEYVLAAEFDNKVGANVKYQYPKEIPGFATINSPKDGSPSLANLMIPDSAEKTPGIPDFTLFLLYYNDSKMCYSLFPNEIYQEPIFFISIVNTLLDETDDRGARIQALALGSKIPTFLTFKPLLVMLIHFYSKYQEVDKMAIIKETYNLINSIDNTIILRLYNNPNLQNILQNIADDELLSRLFNNNDVYFKKIMDKEDLTQTDKFNNRLFFRKDVITYIFDNFKSTILPPNITTIPLQFNIIRKSPIDIVLNYNPRILTFLYKFIIFINHPHSKTSNWKLIVGSTKRSKNVLCEFVAALSNIVGGIGKNQSYLILPYIDVSLLDEVREYMSSNNKSVIIGTANPIFRYQTDIWDYFYDLDTETFYISKPEKEKSPFAHDLFTTSNSLKKILPKQHHESIDIFTNSGHHIREGLLLKLIPNLIKEQHDTYTVISVLKRVNLLQLINVIQKTGWKPSSNTANIELFDTYHSHYKDIVFFPEYLCQPNIQLINILVSLNNSINILDHCDTQTTEKETIYFQLSQLNDAYKLLFDLIRTNKNSISSLLAICNIFPDLEILQKFDLSRHDFSNTNLTTYFQTINGSEDSLMIDSFIRINAFNKLFAFFAFSPSSVGSMSTITDNLRRNRSFVNNPKRLSRSRSLRNIFSLNSNSKSSSSQDNTNYSTRIENKSSHFSSSEPKNHSVLLDKKVSKIKRLMTKIFLIMESNTLTTLFFDSYVSQNLLHLYNKSKLSFHLEHSEKSRHSERRDVSGHSNFSNESGLSEGMFIGTNQ